MSALQSSNIDWTSILRQLQEQQAAANEAQLARYAQANELASNLSQQVGSMGTYGQAAAQLDQVGNAARERIQDSGIQAFAQADQDLTSRGLGNTTIRTAAQRGVNMDTQRATNELDEGLAAQRSGLLERQAGMEFQSGINQIDTLLSRIDQGPDMNLYSNLISQAAAQQPQGKQKITIGPGSTNFGAQYRSTSSGGGGGGGGATGPTTYGGGSSGGGGGGGSSRSVQTFGGGSRTQPATASGLGAGIASYGQSSGNYSSPVRSGPSLGGQTYYGQTGSGQTFERMGDGRVTNDASQPALSGYMQSGTGFISGDNGTFLANQDGSVTTSDDEMVVPPTENPEGQGAEEQTPEANGCPGGIGDPRCGCIPGLKFRGPGVGCH